MRAQEFITEQGMAENKAAGITKAFNSLGDPVYANLQRVALLAMQGRQAEAAGRLQTVIKHVDPAVQKKITDAVNNIKPVTINGRVADSSTLDKSKQHNDWITNTFIPWVQSLLGHQDVTEAKTVEFEGLTLKVIKQDHELTVDALDEWGNKVLGHVKFNIGDGKELDPQDLRVDDKYQGQGIARVMYDYVKSLGYTINRSWDQTDAGAGFWNKHRGEDVRVWEQGVAEGESNAMVNTASRLANKDDGKVAKLRAAGDKRREDQLKGRDIARRDPTSKDEWGYLKQGVPEDKQLGKPVVDAILKVMPIAQEIWFHGSRATGKHRKNSDTDILVVVPDDLVGDQYLGVVRILQKLSSHFDNYDIQPTHPGYNIHLIAQEEGQLLWSNKQDMAENFHDGRNPERKGLAKRSGVNTKASVSSLRKTAKNSSGEKQRMSHWLANMKSGREKAKRK